MTQRPVNMLMHRLGESAGVLVQNIDVVRGRALLVSFEPQAYRMASFLDERVLSPASEGGWARLSHLIEAASAVRQNPALHFIFHTGHVGSTLVSRLLDEAGGVLGLREPMPLRQIAEVHDTLGRPDSLVSLEAFDALLGALLRLWGRGFPETPTVVLKATSSAGRVAPQVLSRQTPARAIYLNVRAETYLATLLGGPNGVFDLRGHGPERMRRLIGLGIADLAPLHRLSPGELAAMSWLAETWAEHNALLAFGERVLAVDFDALLDDIAGSMARVIGHLGIAHDAAYLSGVGRSPVLSRYAKGPEHAFSPQVRAQVLAQSRSLHSEEIRRGLAWLENAAAEDARIGPVIARAGL